MTDVLVDVYAELSELNALDILLIQKTIRRVM